MNRRNWDAIQGKHNSSEDEMEKCSRKNDQVVFEKRIHGEDSPGGTMDDFQLQS
jgi:hypothetical protein